MRTVKLLEEVGELCNEVLTFYALQRKTKLRTNNEDNLPVECADFLITLLLLAQSMNINLEEA